jgi:hypothetical protein
MVETIGVFLTFIVVASFIPRQEGQPNIYDGDKIIVQEGQKITIDIDGNVKGFELTDEIELENIKQNVGLELIK